MSIRATIIMAQLLMIAAAALMLLVSLLADGRSRQALTHWRASTEQLYELVTLARRSNLYGEQFAELILLDSAWLQEKDAEWENRWRARQGKPAIKPLYTVANAEQALSQRRPHAYGVAIEVAKGVQVTFHNAGHILGSAIVEMQVQDHHLQRHLVFSGDLGNTCSPLMQAPTQLNKADVLLMESTYGDRDHRPSDETLEELADILQQAHKEGGNVLIPSFAVQIFTMDFGGARLNYGLGQVRFPMPVRVGSRVRGRATIEDVKETPKGVQVTTAYVVEIEGQERPACVATQITLVTG